MAQRITIVEIPFKIVWQEATTKLGCIPPKYASLRMDLTTSQNSLQQLILYSMSIPTPLLDIKSYRRGWKSAASHALKVVNVNRCDDHDQVQNLKEHAVFFTRRDEEVESLDAGYEEFLWSSHHGLWEKKIEELKCGEGSSTPM